MHVLQLLPTLEVGGVERGVLDLARGLIRRGHQVSVVSSGGRLVPELTAAGAVHYAMPVHRKSPWLMAQQVPLLTKLIRAGKVDVVHARSRVPGWIGWAAARRAGAPFVTTCHGFYRPHPGSRVMTWGRTVIVPSEGLGRYLIDRFDVPPERLRVIPRGVDLAQFPFREAATPGSPPWRIGLIGRITPLKGHDVAFQALHQLVQRGVPVRLCIIGDAPVDKPHLRRRLEELARSLGIADAVEWLGMRSDIPECLQTLDAVIAPSTYPESFGRSLMEAQAAGVPVVASRVGAFADLIRDGETGLLVSPRHPSDLAAAIRRLIEDPALRQRLIRRARQRVEETFTLERMVDQTLDVYQDCLARPRVLVWKLSALGDLVLATPSLRAIRRQFPASPITLVVGRPLYDAVARCPYVNEVLVYDPTRKDRTWLGKWRFIRVLARGAFDVSLDLQNSRFTHLAAALAGARIRIGYARRWKRLLTQPVPLPKGPLSPVAHQHRLLTAAGVAPDGEHLEVWPSPLDEQRADELLREWGVDAAKPLVGIHPGGSARWNTKRWETDRWAALCDRLAEQGMQVVMTGSPAEAGLGKQLLRLTKSKPIVAAGKTRLMELACLIRRFQVYVTLDSAPLHLAAAVGTPAVALFGPTDPARHVPPSPSLRVIKKDVFCSPCYSTRCRTITHACMKRITVEEVEKAIHELCESSTSPRI